MRVKFFLLVGRADLFSLRQQGFTPAALFLFMHILYVDESGSPGDSQQNFFVLAGVSVFERQTYWLTQALNDIADRFNSTESGKIELHGSPMLKRRGIWRAYPRAEREQAIINALEVLKDSPLSNCIFAVVVRPGVTNESPIEYAFMQLASRFDRYLGRLRKTRGTQKGMMLFDKSVHEQTIQSLTTLYQEHGYQWGAD